MISVTDVQVTKDLRYAKVYVSIFTKDDEEKKNNLEALEVLKWVRKKSSRSKNKFKTHPRNTY